MTQAEERIREVLRSAAPPGREITFDDIERAVRRRRSRRWSVAASIVLVLGVAALAIPLSRSHHGTTLAGPSASSALSSSSVRASIGPSGIVAWTNAPAPALPTSLPSSPHAAATSPATGAPACAQGNMTTSLGPSGGLSQHWSVVVTFRNTSRSPCTLSGYPKVRAVEAGLPDLAATNSTQADTYSRAGSLAPGEGAYILLDSPTYCPAYPGAAGHKPTYHQLAIQFPGGGTAKVTIPAGVDLACGLESGPYAVRADQPSAPDPLNHLKVALQVPARVAAGTTFGYVAALTNPTGQPISLAPCPGYLQAAAPSAAGSRDYLKQSYALNCASVGSITAGQTVQFEMRMTMPADVPPGSVSLTWALRGPEDVISTAVVLVTAPTAAHS